MVVWIYGQPCSGKTTMAEKVYTHLFFNAIYQTQLLDGDELRKLFKNNSYDRSGRIANISRAIDIATYENSLKYNVVASFVTPYKEMRSYLKEMLPKCFVIYLEYDASENRGREQNHVSDFDIPSEDEYDLKINTSQLNEEETYNLIIKLLKNGKLA